MMLLLHDESSNRPQVAEIFSADVPVGDLPQPGPRAATSSDPAAASSTAAAALLRDVAYLDTAVTVVDAHQLMHNLHTIHTFRVSSTLLNKLGRNTHHHQQLDVLSPL
jgi:hypothetical protein